MSILLRDADSSDAAAICRLWLALLGERDRGGLRLHSDAGGRLRRWVSERLRERSGIALVAEEGGEFRGFLLARVGEAEAVPPVVRSQKTGWIDAVAVVPEARRRGIGRQLAGEALGRLEARGAERIETTWEAGDPAAAALWQAMGFAPLLEYGWRQERS